MLSMPPVLLLLALSSAAAQGYPPDPPCIGHSPISCVDRCGCVFCTQNGTLAAGLLNGTIAPESLPRREDPAVGECKSRNKACAHGYYPVPGDEVREINGESCPHGGTLVVVWVGVGLLAAGGLLIVALAAVTVVQRRRRRQYTAVDAGAGTGEGAGVDPFGSINS